MSQEYSIQPLSPMRKMIAARMTEALRSIPHFRLGADIEVDALFKLRTELRACAPEDPLSLNDLLIKACAAALMDVPALNVQWAEKELHLYRSADISIVTAVSGGLSTPIIRRADTKSIWEISREVRSLAAKAAKNELKTNEILGGSFSISNLGMYAIEQFDAIINPPQCAILAIGSAKPCVVVSGDQQIRVAKVLKVTLSVDHRAIDGATGARFMSALRERVEHPEHLNGAEAG